MNRFVILAILFATIICTSCEKEDMFDSMYIKGLTLDNYPRVDGSTSTAPLNVIIACELLGIGYESFQDIYDDSFGMRPLLNKTTTKKFEQRIKSSQTHQSFINLINNETDIILSARKMSPDEKSYAEAAGVRLIETPIALDAFVILVNGSNPVGALTIEQIQDIYTGKTTNWAALGGHDANIIPYVRNPNSGSQELMESLVMKDKNFMQLPIASELVIIIWSMAGGVSTIIDDWNGISYSVYYYLENILPLHGRQYIAVEGISPNAETIGNKSYPFTTEVYVVICSDLDKSSMVHQVYEFLQTAAGKQIIRKSGYLPY